MEIFLQSLKWQWLLPCHVTTNSERKYTNPTCAISDCASGPPTLQPEYISSSAIQFMVQVTVKDLAISGYFGWQSWDANTQNNLHAIPLQSILTQNHVSHWLLFSTLKKKKGYFWNLLYKNDYMLKNPNIGDSENFSQGQCLVMLRWCKLFKS